MIYVCCADDKRKEYSKLINNLIGHYGVVDKLENISADGLVLVVGGDGSLNYLCNLLPDEGRFKVLYVPSGTANDFAKALGISPSTHKDMISVTKNSPLVSIPVMECNEKKFINVATIGEPARVTDDGLGLLKEYTGKLSYYINAVDKILNTKPIVFEIIGKNFNKKFESYGAFVSQGIFVGGGVRVSGNVGGSFQETFNLTLAETSGITDSLGCLVDLQSLNFKNDFLINENFEKLVIKSKEELDVKLDGEAYSSKKLEFEKSKLILDFYLY